MKEENEKGKGRGRGAGGGRKPGTPNRITAELRECLKNFCFDNYQTFLKAFAELEPKDLCKVYIDVCKIVTPTLQRVSIENTEQVTGGIEQHLKELSNSINSSSRQLKS